MFDLYFSRILSVGPSSIFTDLLISAISSHNSSTEPILCVEKIAGHDVNPLDYNNIPGCTYCSPEIASVGFTEQQAIENGYE
ncbi:MAG: hypothetical protein HOA90_04905, partial [Prolixibacteraceae bacterium]|nr:hypothetical protein [Prolixibacteraceae bacterium]